MEFRNAKNFAASIVSFFLLIPFTYSASFHSETINFSITTFDSNSKQINTSGDSFIAGGDLQLTTNQRDKVLTGSVGRAIYSSPMHLWDNETGNVTDFTTWFNFSINSENKTLFADGITFFLAPNGSTFPTDSGGENLGLLSWGLTSANSTDTAFVAVEFDTYSNPSKNDIRGPHIGININSLNSVTADPWSWNKIPQGEAVQAFIKYDSRSMNLSVLLTDDARSNSSYVSYRVNLTQFLPEWVIFGFSGTTGSSFEIHTITSWNFNSSIEVVAKETKTNTTTPLVVVVSGGNDSSNNWIWAVSALSSLVLIGCSVLSIWYRRRSSKDNRNNRDGGNDDSGDEEDDDVALPIDEEFEKVASGPKKFAYKELVMATDNFAQERLLGEGGFGKVYEGCLQSIGSRVAIKKITPGSSQGVKEYAAEVKAVSQLRHRNLVHLTGWCHKKKELLLIYEYMPNGSLDSHLFKGKTLLNWEIRYRIAQDLASALLYLHEEWEQCVVHRDVKTSNIMLDSSFNAKLGDFGLARLTDHGKGSQTTVLAGTMGYMAPECLYTGKSSTESDVYSFGIVLLELVCGRKVIEPRAENGHIRLVDWVWELYGTGNLLEAADPKLNGNFDARQMERMMIVGLWCVHPDYLLRPKIREAINTLKFDQVPPTLPSKMPVPMYSALPSNLSTLSFSSPYSSSDGTSYKTESSTFTSSSKASISSTSALLLNVQ